jgi:hypothetical protein
MPLNDFARFAIDDFRPLSRKRGGARRPPRFI